MRGWKSSKEGNDQKAKNISKLQWREGKERNNEGTGEEARGGKPAWFMALGGGSPC
jgi:hypothetical protein